MTPVRSVPMELGMSKGNKPHYWKSKWIGDEKIATEYSFNDIDCDGKMNDRPKREFMVLLGQNACAFSV